MAKVSITFEDTESGGVRIILVSNAGKRETKASKQALALWKKLDKTRLKKDKSISNGETK